jgi:ribosomal protein L11 methyltransferase
VTIPHRRAEQARAMMIELFPQGFEEREQVDGVELAAYTDWRGEERLWHVFGPAKSEAVAADWGDRWRAFHRPVQVGPLWVGPPWLAPPPSAVPVVIDPGRAFGTGAHPTTTLCLELLLELEPASMVDIGCGSGVVAIAAAKLGFSPVLALDHDPAAVEAAEANAAANGVFVRAELCDALAPSVGLPEADVAVANIALDTVLALAPRVRARLFVAAGYLDAEEPRPDGFSKVARRTAAGWAADLFARE